MKDILMCFVFFIVSAHANAQVTNNDFFFYKGKRVDFSFVNTKANSNKFNVVIFESASNAEIEKRIKACTKGKKYIGGIHYLVIPKEFSAEKEELVLEFLSAILSKRKLVDKEMNIVADGNYLTLYKEKIAQTRKYNGGVLNKIEKLSLVRKGDNWCDILE